MANRQDSGSNSAQQNERPNAHNEDAVPEMTDDLRGRSDDDDDEFDDSDTEEVDEDEEADEGNY
jgi:hypothetical protein